MIRFTAHIYITGSHLMRPKQNGHRFPDDIFKLIFFSENVWSSIQISLKFIPTGPINNVPALDQIMAWRRSGDKPLSGPMMISLLTHICAIHCIPMKGFYLWIQSNYLVTTAIGISTKMTVYTNVSSYNRKYCKSRYCIHQPQSGNAGHTSTHEAQSFSQNWSRSAKPGTNLWLCFIPRHL